MHRNRLLVVIAVALFSTAVLPAQTRQDLQVQSDLRQLTERVNRLQLTVNELAEQLKTANGRINQAAEANTKSSANQQLSAGQVTTAIGALRENTQDNTVRISQLAQELGAVRSGLKLLTDQLNSLVGLLQPSAIPPAGAAADATAPPTTVTVPSSPANLLVSAQNHYMSGRYDLAIEGFQEYLQKYPDSADAHSAQLQIGQSYYNKTQCQQALPAYQKVVDSYGSSVSAPDALVMLGMCNADLNRPAQAISFYERVIKQYPGSNQAMLAQQRLDRLRR